MKGLVRLLNIVTHISSATKREERFSSDPLGTCRFCTFFHDATSKAIPVYRPGQAMRALRG
jgi:hypothetical protein